MRLLVLLAVVLIPNFVASQEFKVLPIQGSPTPLPPAPIQVEVQGDTFAFDAPLLAPVSYASYGWAPATANLPLVDFLASNHIQTQIEFSTEQKAQFKDFQKKLQSEYAAIRKEFPALEKKETSAAERRKLNRTVHLKYQEVKKEMSKELEESLVPQQLKMIKQLKFQRTVQMFGFTKAITLDPFKEDIEVSSKQKKELEEIKHKTEMAIQKKMKEMREEAKKKMMKVLDKKQIETIKELEGDSKKTSPFIRL